MSADRDALKARPRIVDLRFRNGRRRFVAARDHDHATAIHRRYQRQVWMVVTVFDRRLLVDAGD